ncbi:MAG: gas vesicle protein GvpG [Beijerinckiaceae bacterium]
MLFSLLMLPVTGPLAGVEWVGKKIHETALAKLNDPSEIKRKLAALEAQLDAGEMGEEEFEALEAELLDRLREASRLLRQSNNNGA